MKRSVLLLIFLLFFFIFNEKSFSDCSNVECKCGLSLNGKFIQNNTVFEVSKDKIYFLEPKNPNSKIVDNYLYAIDNDDHIQIIDISNTLAPSLLSKILVKAADLYVVDRYLYIITHSDKGILNFKIFDISDKTSPTELSSVPVPLTGKGLKIKENYVFIYGKDSSEDYIYVIDISDKQNPKLLTYLRLGKPVKDIFFYGDYLITDKQIYNVGNIENNGIVYIGDIQQNCSIVHIKDNYAYCLDGNENIYVMDFSSLPDINVVNTINVPSKKVFFFYNENLIVSTFGLFPYNRIPVATKLYLIDITDPLNPKISPKSVIRNIVKKVYKVGNYLLLDLDEYRVTHLGLYYDYTIIKKMSKDAVEALYIKDFSDIKHKGLLKKESIDLSDISNSVNLYRTDVSIVPSVVNFRYSGDVFTNGYYILDKKREYDSKDFTSWTNKLKKAYIDILKVDSLPELEPVYRIDKLHSDEAYTDIESLNKDIFYYLYVSPADYSQYLSFIEFLTSSDILHWSMGTGYKPDIFVPRVVDIYNNFLILYDGDDTFLSPKYIQIYNLNDIKERKNRINLTSISSKQSNIKTTDIVGNYYYKRVGDYIIYSVYSLSDYNRIEIKKLTKNGAKNILRIPAYGKPADIYEDYLFLGNDTNVLIYNLNSSNDQLIGSISINNQDVRDIKISDRYLFVIDENQSKVYDINDPYNPAFIGNIPCHVEPIWNDIFYCIDNDNKLLKIYTASDPSSPVKEISIQNKQFKLFKKSFVIYDNDGNVDIEYIPSIVKNASIYPENLNVSNSDEDFLIINLQKKEFSILIDFTNEEFPVVYKIPKVKVLAKKGKFIAIEQKAGKTLQMEDPHRFKIEPPGAIVIADLNKLQQCYFAKEGIRDSDGDGIPDNDELRYGLNPNDSTDANSDFDGDGFSNIEEIRKGTDINNSDSHPAFPVLRVSTNNLYFGYVVIGNQETKKINISNTGNKSLQFEDIQIINSNDFLLNNQCPSVLEKGKSCNISVAFKPSETGKLYGKIYVKTDISTNVIYLYGVGYVDNDGIPDSIEGDKDTDNDGIPDKADIDDDGDGIPDKIEGIVDTDNDGILDIFDNDSDGDGKPDSLEGASDTDKDGIPDFQDNDSDGDNVLDIFETENSYKKPNEIRVLFTEDIFNRIKAEAKIPEIYKGKEFFIKVSDEKSILKPLNNLPVPIITEDKIDNYTFPYGLYSFEAEIKRLIPGSSITITIKLPEPIPQNAKFVKYKENGTVEEYKGKIESSLDGYNWEDGLKAGNKYIRFTIQDGGTYDEDGLKNGRIIDPSGIAVSSNNNSNNENSDKNTGSGGGCSFSPNKESYDFLYILTVLIGFLFIRKRAKS